MVDDIKTVFYFIMKTFTSFENDIFLIVSVSV